MKECALCDLEITDETDSREHLIPNALGGRRKVQGFICASCNNASGESWDAELAKALNGLSVLFNIKRERGKIPNQRVNTTSGDELTYPAEGPMFPAHPTFSETSNESGVEINIVARSMPEARRMMKGVKKKYPQVSLDDLIESAQGVSKYPSDFVHFSVSFGGPLAGRSIVKMAMCLAVCEGIAPGECAVAREYLRNEEAEACFGYFYSRDLVANRPVGMPFHCVAIHGNPQKRLLVGYVELFGVQRSVVCLSDDYQGEKISAEYAIDPTSGETLALDVKLRLSREELVASYEYEKIPSGSIEQAFSSVLPGALKDAEDRERSRVASRAVDKAFELSGCPEGGVLTAEHISKISQVLAEEMEPFVSRYTDRKE